MNKRLSIMFVIPVVLVLSAPADGEMSLMNSEITDSANLQTEMASAPENWQENWQGNWDTKYGQLRLVQDGNRVYGDYHVRGIIEASASRDGNVLRGIFTYPSGRWGTFTFRKRGTRFEGNWRWDGITGIGDEKWEGTKSSDVPAPLMQGGSQSVLVDVKTVLGSSGAGQRAIGTGAAKVRISQWDREAILNFIQFRDEDWLERAAQEDKSVSKGPWQGRYQLEKLGGLGDFSITILQKGDTQKAAAQIQFVPQEKDGSRCRQNLHPEFCQELTHLSGRGIGNQKQAASQPVWSKIQVQGVRATLDYPRSLLIAFKLADDQQPRILRLVMETREIRAEIIHARRGVDYTGRAVHIASICEAGTCEDNGQIFGNGHNNHLHEGDFGIFENREFLARFRPRIDNRQPAHRDQVRLEMTMAGGTHGPHGRRVARRLVYAVAVRP